jgi:hypothetical protein
MLIELLKPIIHRNQQKGAIRKDLAVDTLAYFIIQVQIGIFDFLMIRHKIDIRENIRKNKLVFTVPEKDILSIVGEFTKILKSGLADR